MELSSKCWILVFTFLSLVPVQADSTADTQVSPDRLLQQIEADLEAGRLTSPFRGNAMQRIEQFRRTWPFDYRVLPLAYQWAEATRSQAEQHFANKEFGLAKSRVKQLWGLVPLTPGLESLQQRLDAISPEEGVTEVSVARDVLVPDYVVVDPSVHQQFRTIEDDNSPALASLKLDGDMVDDRNSDIETILHPICEAAVERNASAMIHAEDRVDYRWLMVRLTLCVRRIDRLFRLRHSFRQIDGAPIITLHPPRQAVLSTE